MLKYDHCDKRITAKKIVIIQGVGMHEILRDVQVHIPFHLLQSQYLPMVIRERINPEISFNHSSLDRFMMHDFREVAARLLDEGLTVTFHAPFMDLRPGAIDPRIRQVSVDRLKQVFDLAPFFRPLSVVCHPSYDQRYYVSSESLWLENSIETWRGFLKLAVEMETVIALENVYENDPRQLRLLINALNSPGMRFCFDTGHFNAFSRTPLKSWMDNLGSKIAEIHIHDNNGVLDEHLPVGQGNFPFHDFFNVIREQGLSPIITLESHTEKQLWQMIEGIKTMKLPLFRQE